MLAMITDRIAYYLWRGMGLFFSDKNEKLVAWTGMLWLVYLALQSSPITGYAEPEMVFAAIVFPPIVFALMLAFFRPPPFEELPTFMLETEYIRDFDRWCWQHMAPWRKRRLYRRLKKLEAALEWRRKKGLL